MTTILTVFYRFVLVDHPRERSSTDDCLILQDEYTDLDPGEVLSAQKLELELQSSDAGQCGSMSIIAYTMNAISSQ